MFQDNALLAQLKKQMQDSLVKVEGTVKATSKGFGFLEVDARTSYFIPPHEMKKLLHGDKIIGIVRKNGDRESIEADSLVEQRFTRFVAQVVNHKGYVKVVPDHPSVSMMIDAVATQGVDIKSLKDGDWVQCEMKHHPLMTKDAPKNFFKAKIVEKISSNDDAITPWLVTLAHHELPKTEPEPFVGSDFINSEKELSNLRQDYTHMPFITIDAPTTKDMDDAVHTVAHDDGSFTITVAIADPTAYVDVGSDMDLEASKRAFTTYLPARNIPMLPRNLSDDMCSLREGVVRPSVVCEINILPCGTIVDDFKFSVGFIKSYARLNYDDVSDFLEGVESDVVYDEVVKNQLAVLEKLARARMSWRELNASTFKDTVDYRFEIDENSNVLAVHLDERRIGNRLIEEAMILSNECCGRALQKHFGFGVFNTHSGFDEKYLGDVAEVLAEFSAPTTIEDVKSLAGFSALRRWTSESSDDYVDYRLRKFQSYSDVNNVPSPHFAMGLGVYATWTSPIRKYGDMINHRLIKAMLLGKTAQTPTEEVCKNIINEKVKHKRASRTISDWLYAKMLKTSVTKNISYEAEVFDVSRTGVRVRLLEFGAAAFVPAQFICGNTELLVCDGKNGKVVNNGEHLLKLGDTIKVKLTDVDEKYRRITAKLDF